VARRADQNLTDDYGSGCETWIGLGSIHVSSHEKLETLFGKARSLPKQRETAIASEPYEQSAGERGALKPALERAGRGEGPPMPR
jgi:hypothetical protein